MHVQLTTCFLVKQNLNVYQMDHGVQMNPDVVSSTNFCVAEHRLHTMSASEILNGYE